MRILGVVSSSSREVPGAPTIGTATDVGTGRAYNNGAATVTFTAPTFDGGLPITGYTVTSSPGGFTATGSASPITVSGLQSGTAYTFTVVATNSRGNSAASAASNSITATTVPQAPTVSVANVGTGRAFNNGAATVTITGGATGGKTISSYSAVSNPGSFSASGSSPLTVTGLASNTSYTYNVTATNANGTSTATVSGSVLSTTIPQTPTITSATRISNTQVSIAFTGATGGTAITAITTTSSPSISLSTSGTSSPVTVTGSFATNQAYTFTITATNANGTSGSSNTSGSVTPNVLPTLGAWSTATNYPSAGSNTYGQGNNTYLISPATQTLSGVQNTSYYWNGSTWTLQNYITSLSYVQIGYGPSDTWQAGGGWNNSGVLSNTTASKSSGTAAWSSASTGFQNIYAGIANANGRWIYVGTREQSGSNATIWRTGTGSFTIGATAPQVRNAGNATSFVNNSDNTFAYFWGDQAAPRDIYRTTDGDSWTSVTTTSLISAGNGSGASAYGSVLFFMVGNNTYRWDFSTFTAQTTLPFTPSSGGYLGGPQGNNLSRVDISTPTHYRAPIT